MKKTIKPKFKDSKSEMYSPEFIPHKKEICEPMTKKYQDSLKEKKKKLYPSRKQ